MNKYYHILGVTPNATKEQIRKAYRTKAKIYHPDVNKDSNANEQFILLNEAYEYLMNITGSSTNHIHRAQEKARKQADYQQRWEQQERQKARARAQEHARMKYEAFLKSDIYKASEAINVIFDILLTGVILLLVVVVPILSIKEHGYHALLVCVFILLPSSPLWFRFIVQRVSNINMHHLFSRHKPSIRSMVRNIFLGFIANIIIFIAVVLNTLIEFHTMLILYGAALILGVAVAQIKQRRYYKYMIYFVLAPGILNLFFLINYLFSSHPQTETYHYILPYNSSPFYATIVLEDHRYAEFSHIRLFLVKDKVKGNNIISYQFEDGLLGVKVVKYIETNIIY